MPYRPEAELKRPDLKGEFVCATCEKKFCHAASLNRHRLNFHGGNHYCNICENVVPSKESVRRHMIDHGHERIFTCGCCNWAFPDKKELHIHTSSMSKYNEPGPAHVIARTQPGDGEPTIGVFKEPKKLREARLAAAASVKSETRAKSVSSVTSPRLSLPVVKRSRKTISVEKPSRENPSTTSNPPPKSLATSNLNEVYRLLRQVSVVQPSNLHPNVAELLRQIVTNNIVPSPEIIACLASMKIPASMAVEVASKNAASSLIKSFPTPSPTNSLPSSLPLQLSDHSSSSSSSSSPSSAHSATASSSHSPSSSSHEQNNGEVGGPLLLRGVLPAGGNVSSSLNTCSPEPGELPPSLAPLLSEAASRKRRRTIDDVVSFLHNKKG